MNVEHQVPHCRTTDDASSREDAFSRLEKHYPSEGYDQMQQDAVNRTMMANWEASARRRAAKGRGAVTDEGRSRSSCGHDPESNWFDRTVCPDPCGKMHTCCRECGAVLDGCAHEEGWRR